MWLQNKLSEIQRKPYRQRLKLLWFAVATAAVVTMVVWIITIKVRNMPESPANPFREILENFKNIDFKP